MEVTDAGSAHASAAATIAVGNTLSLPAPASQTVSLNQTVNMNFVASGGVAPYTYTLTAGSLPPNLSLGSSTGTITGTISGSATPATYNFTVQVQDSTSNIATAQSSITVNGNSGTLSLPAPSGVSVTTPLKCGAAVYREWWDFALHVLDHRSDIQRRLHHGAVRD